jgi:protein-S-isoprenylcysteine O-methyltransferase Ste14
MRRELLFHLLFLVILLALGAVRLWYYREQRRSMGRLELRQQETLNEVRQIGAMVACLVIVAHILNPRLLAWTEFPAPEWARWTGAVLSSFVAILSWLAARGELAVARMPSGATFDPPSLFRWVRHPLELVLVGIAVGVTLLSANWVVALVASALALHGLLKRAPRADRERRARLGSAYEQYARVTPAFLPRSSRLLRYGLRDNE